MKKVVLNLALVSVLGAGIFSCASDNEKKLEKKVADLEARIAQMDAPASNAPKKVEPAAPVGPAANFEFEEMSHDFGTIKEGDVVTHEFKFKNTGEAPLIIEKAVGSCGCTVPEYPKGEAIAVGEEGTIKVQFNSKGKPGNQSKTVTITANTNPPTTRLKIKSVVEKAAELTASGPVKN